jgi:SAM-dependent methyltransferase
MTKKFKEFFKDVSTIFTRLKSIEESCADVQIELRQLASVVNMMVPVPAIPPKRLQVRVAGAYNARFFVVGQKIVADMTDVLHAHGYGLQDMANILDFGCGCGRTLIPLSFILPAERISGTDIDKQAIQWMSSNYTSFKDLNVNRVKPPLKYSDASFDFVFGISVFTHLPEKMQNAWLAEIARILKPGGVGLFTTHGEKFSQKLPGPAIEELERKGFYYSVGFETDGLPDFYQTSYQTHDYVRRRWSEHLEVLDIWKEGICKNHDAVLVRRRS